MYILGLTGSIGCGKSHVSSVLRQLGACIIDGDQISHSLTASHGEALPAIRETFGDDVFSHGELDRKALGRLVFSDPAALSLLNSILHPLIFSQIHVQIQRAREKSTVLCVLDMPLLFETGLDTLCDSVWCVYLPEDIQVERIMARDGCTAEDAHARIASQMSSEEKKSRSQTVIDTRGTLCETAETVKRLYSELLARIDLMQ